MRSRGLGVGRRAGGAGALAELEGGAAAGGMEVRRQRDFPGGQGEQRKDSDLDHRGKDEERLGGFAPGETPAHITWGEGTPFLEAG